MMNRNINPIKRYLQNHGVSIVELSKASGIHNSRTSQLINLWIKPSLKDTQRLRKGFEILSLNTEVLSEITNLYEKSLPINRKA